MGLRGRRTNYYILCLFADEINTGMTPRPVALKPLAPTCAGTPSRYKMPVHLQAKTHVAELSNARINKS